MNEQILSQLERLGKLKEQGLLTQQEFDTQKAAILSVNASSPPLTPPQYGPLPIKKPEVINTDKPGSSIWKIVGFLILGIVLIGIIDKLTDSPPKPLNTTPSSTIPTPVDDSTLLAEVNAMPDTKAKLKNFTEADVARFVMATVMYQPPKIISATKGEGYYIISYKRPSDGQKFVYKVKFEGSRAIWANIDGRWRTLPPDDGIQTFAENGKKLKIFQRFSDGSSDEKEYSKQ